MRLVKITDDLFEVYFRVQLKHEDLYQEMFPVESNKVRLNAAIYQTGAMLAKHQRKAPWAIESANKTMLAEMREAKVRRLTEEELKEAIKGENMNFPRVDLDHLRFCQQTAG